MSEREKVLYADDGEFNCGFCLAKSGQFIPCSSCLLPSIAKSFVELKYEVKGLNETLGVLLIRIEDLSGCVASLRD